MQLLPENAEGPAAIIAGLAGAGLFVWRFFWGAKKVVRDDGIEGSMSTVYKSLIDALRSENDRLSRRNDEIETRLHDVRNEAADLKMENYKLSSDIERLRMMAEAASNKGPAGGAGHG